MKGARGKLEINRERAQKAIEELQIRVMPYIADHAFALFDLPPHHRDPFDRQIIAQALAENIPVVTPDQAFRLYQELTVIW